MADFQIYDDIDEEDVTPSIANEDSVSRFCIAIYNATKKEAIGSGVLINDKGLFISAAHNFNKEENDIMKAYFDGKQYDINIIHKEYEQGICDLCIGTLVGFESDEYVDCTFPVFGGAFPLRVGSELTIAGYKKLKLRETENLGVVNPIDNLCVTKQRFNSDVQAPDSVQKSLQKELGNRVVFFLKRDGVEKFKGFSGGPVYQDNTIYGIVVSHYFLKSDYIKSMLERILTIH